MRKLNPFSRICNSAVASISICNALKWKWLAVIELQILILDAGELQIRQNGKVSKYFPYILLHIGIFLYLCRRI